MHKNFGFGLKGVVQASILVSRIWLHLTPLVHTHQQSMATSGFFFLRLNFLGTEKINLTVYHHLCFTMHFHLESTHHAATFLQLFHEVICGDMWQLRFYTGQRYLPVSYQICRIAE